MYSNIEFSAKRYELHACRKYRAAPRAWASPEFVGSRVNSACAGGGTRKKQQSIVANLCNEPLKIQYMNNKACDGRTF